MVQPEPNPSGVAAGGSRTRPGLGAALELAALGLGLTLSIALMARLPSWSHDLGAFQLLYALAFAFFALALLGLPRYRRLPRAGLAVFAVALAARLALLPVTPSLSDDLYRYVWEGRVAAHGGDPYAQGPLDPALESLRDREIWPRVNHPELSTIYPPLGIAGFALVAAISPTVLAMKSWVVLHDLVTVGLLLAWSRRRSESAVPVIAYAWNPLVLVEHAGSGHNDPTAMMWLVAALMLAEERPTLSALALVAGSLTKLAPLIAFPFLVRIWPWRARLLALGLLAAGLGWYVAHTRHAGSGAQAYFHSWRNNQLAFQYFERWTGNYGAARRISWVLVGCAVGFAWWKKFTPTEGTRLAMRAGFLTSPVAHPWYLAWPLVLEPQGPSAPWALLSLTVMLSYGVLASPSEGGNFHLPLAWRWIEFGLPLLLASGLALRSGRVRG